MPRVTLALPVYNGEKYVVQAIRSILAQDYTDFELIITDNASTDGTEKICREFAATDKRIKYFRNERNLGAAPNFNRGFELATGEYFKWCSCDDLMSEDYVGACVKALDANQDAVLAYGTTRHIDADGRPIFIPGVMMPEMTDPDPAYRFYRAVTDFGWTIDQEIFGVFRTDALKKSSLHRPYFGADHTLLREMALLGQFVHVPGIVFYNRDHSERSVKIADEAQKHQWQGATTSDKHSFFYVVTYHKHLLEIVFRHRRLVSPARTVPSVLLAAANPRVLVNLAIDVTGFVSPSLEVSLRKSCRWIFHKLRPPPTGIVRRC
jgi:glycosyltransferase involved in cell wall biosynthesis